jgi:hypothetical protein
MRKIALLVEQHEERFEPERFFQPAERRFLLSLDRALDSPFAR